MFCLAVHAETHVHSGTGINYLGTLAMPIHIKF